MSLQLSGSRPRQLQYSASGLRRDLRLLEVDDALLGDIAAGGVVVKGGPGDDAVLCTGDRTYALKYVETTNTLLMLPPDAAGDADFGAVGSATQAPDASLLRDVGLQTQIQKASTAGANPPLVATATAVAHIEAVHCPPRLGQLRELLAACRPYGIEDEGAEAAQGGDCSGSDAMAVDGLDGLAQPGLGGGGAAGFTTAQLEQLVQASRSELLRELEALNALRLAGRWRLVDEDYLGRLLEVLLLSATEAGWPLEAVPLDDAAVALAADGYAPALVAHCLGVYGDRTDSRDSSGGSASGAFECDAAPAPPPGTTFSLDCDRVCLHFARKLLRSRPGSAPAPGAWLRSEFMAAWSEAVPEEWAPPNERLLAGEALEDLPEGSLPGADTYVLPFAARDLPLEPAPRFAALFARRPRWERSQLEPYLVALTISGGQKVEALLLKYARGSQGTPDAPLFFSAR
ncbi:sister chromatid cohesion DCC1 [Raphidocelis subcapitata]|uniref:Sister chromatid cohesion DCC1 n=1 Tax=Raphidocelis subcapitata TaxID=307507 RepID=A0A2V0NNS1_9CHLO|nr:sister chromatid cohesion DCC1 [Raphidocelis subcapitata]|eukprot:GBF89216.1 sister chromatid cohesion DCC1 [Raphidocelis subcapitata]